MKLNDMVKIANSFANDLKLVHWHATGEKFDTIHSVANELYEEVLEELDDFAEMAISEGLVVESLNAPCEDWEAATDTSYDWDKFVSFLATSGQKYLDGLNALETENKGHQSKIDEYINFWSKEISYKNSNRAIEEPKVENTTVEVVDSEEESNMNDDAFIGMDSTSYADAYDTEVEETEDLDLDNVSDLFNPDNKFTAYQDIVNELGNPLVDETLDVPEDFEDEDEANLSPMSNDMVFTSGEPVESDSFDKPFSFDEV